MTRQRLDELCKGTEIVAIEIINTDAPVPSRVGRVTEFTTKCAVRHPCMTRDARRPIRFLPEVNR